MKQNIASKFLYVILRFIFFNKLFFYYILYKKNWYVLVNLTDIRHFLLNNTGKWFLNILLKKQNTRFILRFRKNSIIYKTMTK